MIHFEVDVDLFGVEEARRNLSKVDPQVQTALGLLRRGQGSSIAKKTAVESVRLESRAQPEPAHIVAAIFLAPTNSAC